MGSTGHSGTGGPAGGAHRSSGTVRKLRQPAGRTRQQGAARPTPHPQDVDLLQQDQKSCGFVPGMVFTA